LGGTQSATGGFIVPGKKLRGLRAASASILLVACMAGVLSSTAPAAAAASSSEITMANLINRTRIYHGIPGLKLDAALSNIARGHSLTMARAGFIFHTTSLVSALRSFTWRVAGENVGMGPSILALHNAFQASAPHRANNLYKGYRRFGVGVVWRSGFAFITVQFIG
jgi:uncharacterized protein YkwD